MRENYFSFIFFLSIASRKVFDSHIRNRTSFLIKNGGKFFPPTVAQRAFAQAITHTMYGFISVLIITSFDKNINGTIKKTLLDLSALKSYTLESLKK